LEETDNLELYVSQNMNGILLKVVKFLFSSSVLAACKEEERCCHWLKMLFCSGMFSDLHALEKSYVLKKNTLLKNTYKLLSLDSLLLILARLDV